MSDGVKTANDFLKAFNLPRNGFTEGALFSDAYGFSTTKRRKQNGLDFLSLYKLYIRDNDMRSDVTEKPITAVVSYGELQDDGSIMLAPTSIPRRSDWPLDFVSTEEFYYNIETSTFTRKGDYISAEQILSMLDELHLRPTKFWGGLWLRLRVFIRRTHMAFTFQYFYYFVIGVLYSLFGTRTVGSLYSFSRTTGRGTVEDEREFKQETFATEAIDVLGYKAKNAWAVITYGLAHFSIYSYWYFFDTLPHPFISSVFSNAFLTLVYVVPTLVIYERLLPHLLRKLIALTRLMYQQATFSRIDLKF